MSQSLRESGRFVPFYKAILINEKEMLSQSLRESGRFVPAGTGAAERNKESQSLRESGRFVRKTQ